jgi:hypothetical protein
MSRRIVQPEPYEPNEHKDTLEAYNISPDEIQSGDQFGYKVIAVLDNAGHYWSAFKGYSSWSDDFIRENGERLPKGVACALFYPLSIREDLIYYDR